MVNKLYLVTPRGFCAGVEMAIKALHWLLKIYDETIYKICRQIKYLDG